MEIGQKKVYVVSQEVNISEHDGWADVSILEQYQSSYWGNQEIVYYFSLPETSVITGLWLSNTSETRQFPYKVSPRGAAQKVSPSKLLILLRTQVYTTNVLQKVDPALIEQVGPCQYHLRVFPISSSSDVFMWLSYR